MKRFQNISIVAIGRHVPSWAHDAINSYLDRMKTEQVNQIIVDLKQTKKLPDSVILKQENDLLVSKLPKDNFYIALDKTGVQWNNQQLLNTLTLSNQSKPITFIIGGALGLNQQVLTLSNCQWSLSNLIFPHSIARLLLVEQLYRSYSISCKHPYHRE